MLAAGGMDHKVRNYYMRYFGELPRDPWEYFLNNFCLDNIRRTLNTNSWWFIDFMAVALILYNRLKIHIVKRQKNNVKWRTFMMGTHPRAGQDSGIIRIRGIPHIIEKLELFVLGKPKHVEEPISKLSNHIQKILTAVHKKNNLIIPCIIDKSLISAAEAGDIRYDFHSPET